MERTLSQSEIDQLIQAVSSVAADETPEGETELRRSDRGKVVRYDFRRPNKFSREQLRALERIHQQFARAVSTSLSARLRTEVSARLMTLQQLTYSEFTNSIPNPSVIGVFDVSSLQGNVILQVSFEFAMMVFERLCGGKGKGPGRSRELTEIELAIIRKYVFDMLGESYTRAWDALLELSFGARGIESNPLYLNLMLDQDVVILASIQVTMGGEREMINIGIPFSILEPFLPKLTTNFLLKSGHTKDAGEERLVKSNVRRSIVGVDVILGRTELTVEELLDLEVGDIVVLDTTTSSKLDVAVGGLVKFQADPGIVDGHYGCMITSESTEEMEGLGR